MRIPKKLNPQEADVMIVDAAGSDCIKHCIPVAASVEVLPLRGVIPWLMKPSFFIRVCTRLIQKKSLGHSVVCAIIDVLKPKVLITFIDNAPLMGYLQDIFPEKLLISVQNGLRSEVPLLGGSDVNYKLPVLYGYGVYEKTMLKKRDIKVLEYIPVGSLRYGIFRHNNPKVEKKYDICYISQFSELSACELGYLKALQMLLKYEKRLFLSLLRVCEDNGYRFSVALRGRAGSKKGYNERNYFKSLDTENVAKLIDISQNDLGSYKTVSSATINVALISTLAMEVFGGGGKVLWALPPDLLAEWGIAMNFEKMPEEIVLNSLESDSINKKYITLSKMEQKQYLEITETARNFYMKFQKPYPHEVIKKRIADFIENI